MSTHPEQQHHYSKIGQLVPELNNISVIAIVIDSGFIKPLANGNQLLLYRIADPTGSIMMSIMNPEVPDLFLPSDIIKLKGGFTKINRGGLTLGVGRNGEVVKCNEFFMQFSETPNMSESNPEWTAIERKKKEAREQQQASQQEGGDTRPSSDMLPQPTSVPPAGRQPRGSERGEPKHRPPASGPAPHHRQAPHTMGQQPPQRFAQQRPSTNVPINLEANNGRAARHLNGTSGQSTILDRLIS